MVLFVSTITLFLKVGNYKKVIWIFWRFAVFNGWFLNLFDFDRPSSEAEFKAFKPCRWTAKKTGSNWASETNHVLSLESCLKFETRPEYIKSSLWGHVRSYKENNFDLNYSDFLLEINTNTNIQTTHKYSNI